MSTGGEKIGGAFVEVEADLTKFDAALDALPAKMRGKMDAAMKSLQAQMAQSKLDLKVAIDQSKITGNTAPVVALTGLQERLKDKIDAVSAAATRQAQAFQATAVAQANATAQAKAGAEAAKTQAAAVQAQAVAAQRLAAAQAGFGSSTAPRGMTDAAMAAITKAGGDPRLAGLAGMPVDLDKLGDAGEKAGKQVRAGGMSGAMGLMVLSQTIDDAQYGFRSIVNNIPMLGMALGNALGKGAEFGMKFGAILGIAGVAVNLLLTHWDKLMDLMGLGRVKTEAEQMEELGKKVGKTADEVARLAKYEKERAEIKKIGGLETDEQKETRAKVEDIFARAGTGDIRGALAGQFARPMLPAEEKFVGPAPALDDPALKKRYDDRLKKIQDRIQNEALNRADKVMAKATLTGPEGDAARAEIDAKLKRANKSPLGLGAIDVRSEMLTEQGMEVQAEMNEKARELDRQLTEQGVAQQDEHFAALAAERSRTAGRVAGAMDRSVGTQLLLNPTMSQDELEGRIRKGLERAGASADEIGKLMPEISVKLREKLEHAIQDRAMERNISPQEARLQLIREEREKDVADRKKAGGTNQIFTDEEYSRRLLMATQNTQGKDRTPEEQLKAQQAAVEQLKQLVKLGQARPANGVARFAGGRARP